MVEADYKKKYEELCKEMKAYERKFCKYTNDLAHDDTVSVKIHAELSIFSGELFKLVW